MALNYPLNLGEAGGVGQLLYKAGVNSGAIANLAVTGITGGVISFTAALGADITISLPTVTCTLASSSSAQTYTGGKQTFAVATATYASINLPPTAAIPSSPVNGDMWTTATGLYVQIGGVTVGPLGAGGGGIAGSIAVNQIAVGSGTDTIGGSANLTWDGTTFDCTGRNSLFGGAALTLGDAGTQYPDVGYNVVRDATEVTKYRVADTAARLQIGNAVNPFSFQSAALGAPAGNITWKVAGVITAAGVLAWNYGLSTLIDSATANILAVDSGIAKTSAGSVLSGTNFFTRLSISAGSITASHGLWAQSPVVTGSGAITTAYGARIEAQKSTGVTTGYGVWQDSSADLNYFAGVTGVGIAPSATAALVVPAATTALSSIRITHGVAPTAPVNGDMWTTTAGLFVQINGSTVALGAGSGGTIGGSIAANQIAYGSGINAIQGAAKYEMSALAGITSKDTFSVSTPGVLRSAFSDASYGTSAAGGDLAFNSVSITPQLTATGDGIMAYHGVHIEPVNTFVSASSYGPFCTGIYINILNPGAYTTTSLIGMRINQVNVFGATSGSASGIEVGVIRAIGNQAVGLSIESVASGAGQAYGVRVQTVNGEGGYSYGLHINSVISNGTPYSSLAHGIYQVQTDILNYLGGNTGIGIAASDTSKLVLAAGTTAISSLRIPHGVAPTAPVNGDIWTTTSGLFARINGSTVTYGAGTIGGSVSTTQVAYGSGTNTITGNAGFVFSPTMAKVVTGATYAGAYIATSPAAGAATDDKSALYVNATLTPTGTVKPIFYGATISAAVTGAVSTAAGTLCGAFIKATNGMSVGNYSITGIAGNAYLSTSGGTGANVTGLEMNVTSIAGSTISTSIKGGYFYVANGGTTTNKYGIDISVAGTGVTQNVYGLNVGVATTGVQSTFGIYESSVAGTMNQLSSPTGVGGNASLTSALTLVASTTAKSSLRISHGSAPTAPVNGDIWTTTSGLFAQINGVTKAYGTGTISGSAAANQVAIGSGVNTISGSSSFTVTTVSGGLDFSLNSGVKTAAGTSFYHQSYNTATSGASLGANFVYVPNPASSSTSTAVGLRGECQTSTTTAQPSLSVTGIKAVGYVGHTGTSGVTVAGDVKAFVAEANVFTASATASCSCTSAYSIFVDAARFTGTAAGPLTIGSYYGLYIDGPQLSNATVTNNYGIYQVDTTAKNVFSGYVGIRTAATTTAALTLAASTATVAPLRFTLFGTVPTTPNFGDVWMTNNDGMFFSHSSITRSVVTTRLSWGTPVMSISGTATITASSVTVANFSTAVALATAGASSVAGVYNAFTLNGVNGTDTQVTGIGSDISMTASTSGATVYLATGFKANVDLQNTAGAGTVATFRATGVDATVQVRNLTAGATWNVDYVYGAKVALNYANTGTVNVTNSYCLYIEDAGTMTCANRWGIYQQGPASGATRNYLFSNTGIYALPSTSTYLVVGQGTTAISSLRIPHGAAPTSPVNGDMWTTTAGLYIHINGVTVGPLT